MPASCRSLVVVVSTLASLALPLPSFLECLLLYSRYVVSAAGVVFLGTGNNIFFSCGFIHIQ